MWCERCVVVPSGLGDERARLEAWLWGRRRGASRLRALRSRAGSALAADTSTTVAARRCQRIVGGVLPGDGGWSEGVLAERPQCNSGHVNRWVA